MPDDLGHHLGLIPRREDPQIGFKRIVDASDVIKHPLNTSGETIGPQVS